MNHNIGIVLATMALVVASMVAAAPGGKHGPGGHDHGPRNDHGPRGHDHRSGHDHGPRGHDHGHDRDQPTEANEVAPLEPGRCTKIVSATVTATQSYQTRRRVATRTRCGWLHLAHCRKYRWNPHVAYRQVTKLVYVNVRKCCVGFMEVNGVCEPQGGRTLPPPTTIITAPPASTTPRDDSIPDDEMMMIDNSLQKFVFFVIVLVTILIIGIVIGAVVVHLCGGRKEVMRRISTRRFHRKTRKETTKDLNGKTCGKTPEDDPPPRYQSFNKHDKQTPSTKGAGVAYHPHGHDHSNDHAHGHSYGHKHGHTHDQTHGHTHNHSHKGYQPTAPPNDEEYANADMMDARPKVALPVPGNGVKAKSCDAQAGYVEIYESEPIPAKHGHH